MTPPPTREEERDLVLRARAGNLAARDELVTRHLPFVRRMAWKFCYRHLGTFTMEDLEQVALQAFVECLNSYDPERGIRLTTFGGGWIRGRILDILNDRHLIRIPKRRQKDPHVVALSVIDSIDPEDPGADDPLKKAQADEQATAIRVALQHLPVRERQMVVRRFGLGGRTVMTLRAIGEEFGISAERVRQLLNRAMGTMREHLPEGIL